LADKKRVYEAMFLVDSALATTEWDKIIGEIETVMQRAEAEVISIRKWDERRLQYEIAGRKRGTYILSYFRALPSKINGMERDVQLNEHLLRVLILRADHLTEEEMSAETPAMRAERQERDSAARRAERAEKAAKAEKAAPTGRRRETAEATGGVATAPVEAPPETQVVTQAEGEPAVPAQAEDAPSSRLPAGEDENDKGESPGEAGGP